MTAPFDFQALAERARADNPDAAIFEAIETIAEQSRLWRRAPRIEQKRRAWAEAEAARERLAALRPATRDGLLAKLRQATPQRRGAAKRKGGTDLLGLPHAAMLDAVVWLEGRAAVGASDTALFEAMQAEEVASRRFQQAFGRWRRRRRRGGVTCDELGEPGCPLPPLAAAAGAARDRLAAIRPATLEGLSAKLRHAARTMHRCPAVELEHTALLDAIAWLGPTKRRRRLSAELGAA